MQLPFLLVSLRGLGRLGRLLAVAAGAASLVAAAACGSGSDDGTDAADRAEVTVTMSPAAAPDAKRNAIAACGDKPGVAKVIDESAEATIFRVDLTGSTYEQQLDVVKCLGDQKGIQQVRETGE